MRRVLVLLSLVASVAILAGVAGAEATTMIVSERGSLVAIALPRS